MHDCQTATTPEAKNISDCLATVWEGLVPRADADRLGNSLAGCTMLRSGWGWRGGGRGGGHGLSSCQAGAGQCARSQVQLRGETEDHISLPMQLHRETEDQIWETDVPATG